MKEKKKSNRVSGESGSKLRQVKPIRKADPPSKVGLKVRNIPQRKASHFPTSCPSAYVPFKKEYNVNQLKDKLSRIPQIRWEIPPEFVLESDWLVASGEESGETTIQKLRETSVRKAVYPHFSVIPPSPFTTSDVEDQCYDDSQTPVIPITPIVEADSTATVPLSSSTELLQLLNQLKATTPPKYPLPPQPSSNSKSAPVEGDTLLAAVAAVTAIMRSMDPGSLIDTDLLIKFLSDPKMTLQLIHERRQAANNTSEPSESKISEPSVPFLTSEAKLPIKKLKKEGSKPTEAETVDKQRRLAENLSSGNHRKTVAKTANTEPGRNAIEVSVPLLTSTPAVFTKTSTTINTEQLNIGNIAVPQQGADFPSIPRTSSEFLTKKIIGAQDRLASSGSQVSSWSSTSGVPIKTATDKKDWLVKSAVVAAPEPLPQSHVTKTGPVAAPNPGRLSISLPTSTLDLPSKQYIAAQSQLVTTEMVNVPTPIISPPIVAGTGIESCFTFKPGQKTDSQHNMLTNKAATKQCHSINAENVAPAIPRPPIHSLGERIYGTELTPKPLMHRYPFSTSSPHIVQTDKAATKQSHLTNTDNVAPAIPRPPIHSVGERTYGTGFTPKPLTPRYPFSTSTFNFSSNEYASEHQDPVANISTSGLITEKQQLSQPRKPAGLFTNSVDPFGTSSDTGSLLVSKPTPLLNSELKDEHGVHDHGAKAHAVRTNPQAGNPSQMTLVGKPSQPDLAVIKRMIRDYGLSDNLQCIPGSEPSTAPMPPKDDLSASLGDNPEPTQHPSAFGASPFSARTTAPPSKDLRYYQSLIKQHGDTHNNGDHQQSPHTSQRPEFIRKPKTQEPPCFYFNTPKGCRNGSRCLFRHEVVSDQQRRPIAISEVHDAKRMKLGLGRELIGRT